MIFSSLPQQPTKLQALYQPESLTEDSMEQSKVSGWSAVDTEPDKKKKKKKKRKETYAHLSKPLKCELCLLLQYNCACPDWYIFQIGDLWYVTAQGRDETSH